MKYERACERLDIGMTTLLEMLKAGLICSVEYGPGRHPRIPLSEIQRLCTVKPLPVAKPRGKPSRRRRSAAPGIMTPEQLSQRIATLTSSEGR